MKIGEISESSDINYQILRKMTEDYSSLESVDAIGLGGSSAVKSSDSHSDYDIYIYGKSEPSVDSRRKIASKYHKTHPFQVKNRPFGHQQ